MSIWKLLPATVHGVADFASALTLIVVAVIVGGSGTAVATGVGAGLALIAVSLLTNYPLGAVKVIPFRLHSAGDYLGALGLLGAPFLLGFRDTDPGLSTFYVVAGFALLAVSLVTDYSDASGHEPATLPRSTGPTRSAI